jgi:DNA-binding GntR family transcriptional regulator
MRDQARDLVREMIVAGDIEGGDRLDEVGLSVRLGASRTPVREALIALEEEGMVESRPNRGFVATAADARLVREIYPILCALEGAAVETGGEVLRSAVPQLKSVTAQLSSEPAPKRRYALDREFHRLLVAPCGNERLQRLIELNWHQARRIDGGDKRGMANHAGSVAEHRAIVREIERGDLMAAAELLRDHWRGGIGVVLRWMEKSR